MVVNSGPGIRPNIAQNPGLPTAESDIDAIALAVQGPASETATPTRGNQLSNKVAEMRRPGRKLIIHSSTPLLVMYGAAASEITELEFRRGTVVRATIPF